MPKESTHGRECIDTFQLEVCVHTVVLCSIRRYLPKKKEVLGDATI